MESKPPKIPTEAELETVDRLLELASMCNLDPLNSNILRTRAIKQAATILDVSIEPDKATEDE
jgi:hypothetical protein